LVESFEERRIDCAPFASVKSKKRSKKDQKDEKVTEI